MFRILAGKLLSAIKAARNAVQFDHSVDIYRSFCFKDGRIWAWDGEFGVVVDAGLPFDLCVNAERLLRIFKQLDEDKDVDLSVDARKTLRVSQGAFKVSLQTTDTAFYPRFLPEKLSPAGDPTDFSSALSQVVFCAGPFGSSRPGGVGIRGYWTYATDGVRAARVKTSAEFRGEATISDSSARKLIKFGEPASLLLGPSSLLALYPAESMVVVVGMQARPFPFVAVDKMVEVPRRGETIVEFPGEVLAGIERVQSMASTTEQAGGLSLVADGSNLTIAKVVAEVGASSESFPLVSPQFNIIVSGEFLKAALSRSRAVDLSDVVGGAARKLRFVEQASGFEHIVALIDR